RRDCEPFEQIVGDRRRQALEQIVAGRGCELEGARADGAVVDGVRQPVAAGGGVGAADQPQVDHKRLAVLLLVLVHAVVGERLQPENLDHRRGHRGSGPLIAAETSSASRTGPTSWTRNIQAPRPNASRLAEIVPAVRSRSARPVIWPRKRLRETAISTG